ncbi:hypothetical protein HNY73_008211 [Argiope bruennichi]|uniref:Uncharacterized protein n=1 Tax=Argiope bruennichi TaxID=94029 RepID=A0A8T0FAW6_ARGBR|nr:hypothetical protein HNY73_008211 [Argiope bruennichi]
MEKMSSKVKWLLHEEGFSNRFHRILFQNLSSTSIHSRFFSNRDSSPPLNSNAVISETPFQIGPQKKGRPIAPFYSGSDFGKEEAFYRVIVVKYFDGLEGGEGNTTVMMFYGRKTEEGLLVL